MIAVTMLIYIVSLVLQFPSCVNIFNLCLNTKLISPVYFGNGAICPKLSNQQIDISTAMKACFEINATQDDFEGALLLKLQKYVGSNDQCNMNTLATETNKSEEKCVQMLVAWKVEDSKHFLHVVLIEHAKEFNWNEDELRKLYNKNHNRLKQYNGIISDTWLMDDNRALKTSFKVRNTKENFELNISISEEEKDDYAIRPLYVNLER
jgi:hypothetical protein